MGRSSGGGGYRTTPRGLREGFKKKPGEGEVPTEDDQGRPDHEQPAVEEEEEGQPPEGETLRPGSPAEAEGGSGEAPPPDAVSVGVAISVSSAQTSHKFHFTPGTWSPN